MAAVKPCLLYTSMLVFEFCAENLTYIDKAIAAGAGRIELCDNLAVGGTTPSIGVINEAKMCIRDSDMGVKASGGARSYEDALAFIEAGATRIGTSSGVAIMEGKVAHGDY